MKKLLACFLFLLCPALSFSDSLNVHSSYVYNSGSATVIDYDSRPYASAYNMAFLSTGLADRSGAYSYDQYDYPMDYNPVTGEFTWQVQTGVYIDYEHDTIEKYDGLKVVFSATIASYSLLCTDYIYVGKGEYHGWIALRYQYKTTGIPFRHTFNFQVTQCEISNRNTGSLSDSETTIPIRFDDTYTLPTPTPVPRCHFQSVKRRHAGMIQMLLGGMLY